MTEDFYRAFEDKYRGSRELIRSRLHVYLPFITPLKDVYPDAEMVDLGCGRGEWLELIDEKSISGQGVDIDDGMLAACHELGLSAEKGDALSYLKSLPDESKVVISGFHIAEHLLFEDLQLLVAESLRVLKPAGLLILETPNPENIVVGTSEFYLDPTHQRPIPPQLLAFLPEYYGFEKVKILRLQDAPEKTTVNKLSLLTVLNGVSPDYAVVAQKSIGTELQGFIIKAFDIDYGVTLEHLATSYGHRIENIELQIQQASERAQQAESQSQQASERAEQAESQVQQASEQTRHVTNQLESLYCSRSWRITAPFRWLGHQVRLLKEHGIFSRIKALFIKIFRPFISWGASFIKPRAGLRHRCYTLTRRLGIYESLRPIYLRSLKSRSPMRSTPSQHVSMDESMIDHLTPQARRVYADIKKALAQRDQGGA